MNEIQFQNIELEQYKKSLDDAFRSYLGKAKKLNLSKGMFALVDVELFEDIEKVGKWQCQETHSGIYARNRNVYLQQVIMKQKQVGFRNKLTLDCTRQNLFARGRQGVLQNKSGKQNTSSSYKGVFKRAAEDRWTAQIKDKVGTLGLGRYEFEEEAARVYDAAVELLFGDHGYKNFVGNSMENYREVAQKYVNTRKRRLKKQREKSKNSKDS